MAVFAVTSTQDALEAINYAISNLGQSNGLIADLNTGVISTPGDPTPVAYLYQYINIRYATAADGSTGFSTSPTNATYYGVRNSTSSTASSNPTDYVWYQVSGGFGTTKFLYYSAIGGRQIVFVVGTSAPSGNYVQTTDGVAIDLDVVTTAAASTATVVIVNVFQRASSAPATPTGGTYDFDTLTLTAPTGWSTSVPSGTDPIYLAQNTFESPDGTGTYGPSKTWTTPVILAENGTNGTNGTDGVSVYTYSVFQQSASAPSTPTGGSYDFATATGTPPTGWDNYPISTTTDPIWVSTAIATATGTGTWTGGVSSWSTPVQYTGSGGVDGERGFIPMAYVVTPTDPAVANTATLSSWFSALRTNTSAPIGVSPDAGNIYLPIPGDTAQFYYATTPSTVFKTYDGSAWSNVTGQVIDGDVLVSGSVTANALSANDVYTLKIQSTGADFGNTSSTGFWLDGNTGNARFGGNVSIGANLNVQGLITTGTLDANTVSTEIILNQAVTTTATGEPDYPGTYQVSFVEYANVWAANTRGIAMSGGTSILPTTDGSLGGSKIVVQFNIGVYSDNPTYNIVELWKSGASETYDENYVSGVAQYPGNYYVTSGNIYFVGDGYGIKSTDNGSTFSTVTFSDNLPLDTAWLSREKTGSSDYIMLGSEAGNILDDSVFGGGLTSVNIANPSYNIYGSRNLNLFGHPSDGWAWICGATGLINLVKYNTTYSVNLVERIPIATAYDLYDIAQDWSPYQTFYANTQVVTAVAVGSNGTIYRGQYTLTDLTDPTAIPSAVVSFTNKARITTASLRSVDSNWTEYSSSGLVTPTQGNMFVAVGDGGVIIRSLDNGNTWTSVTSPTTENLHCVRYSHNNVNKTSQSSGYWVAVGDNATIIVSTDGTANSWTQVSNLPASTNAVDRDLYSLVFSSYGSGNTWMAAGQAIVYRSTTLQPSSGNNWSRVYDTGPVSTSELTKLQYFGSSGNTFDTSQPAVQYQINNQVITSSYTDYEYTSGNAVTYFLVAGNLNGNTVYAQSPSMIVTEYKR